MALCLRDLRALTTRCRMRRVSRGASSGAGNEIGVRGSAVSDEKWFMSTIEQEDSSMHKDSVTQDDSGFMTEYQVYEPHKTGLPPMRPYLTELWRRRHFAAELSRTNMRASNTRTFFGQIWLVINPLLLACVYYLMVNILAHRANGMTFMDHLVAGIFAYYLVSGCIATGASSVVGSGKLISNMAFPRLLMPLSACRTAFFRFTPTVPVSYTHLTLPTILRV